MTKQSKNRRYAAKPTQPVMIKTPGGINLVSIIIPVFNRFDLLQQCLDAIPEAFKDISYEVILVDNGSDKAGADAFYRSWLNVTVIRNKENLGFSRACNLGAKRTRSPLIFLLNSDVILDPGSGLKLVTEMDDPSVGICGMKLVYPDDVGNLNAAIRPAGKVQHIGISMNIKAEAYHIYLGWDEDHPKVMGMHDVWAVTGAALMVRRSLWNKVGGLAEIYGLGTYEDLELCQAVRMLKYRITVVPEARGLHYAGGTAESQRIPYPLSQNRMIFLQRWDGKLEWWDGKML